LLREFVISLSMRVLCLSLANIVICIKCIFSRCCPSATLTLLLRKRCNMQALFDFGDLQMRAKSNFHRFQLLVHTAICVIEIFRVIKRNYLDSTDSLHWCEVIAWRELKTIKFNCFECRQINLNTFADFTNSFSNIFSLFMHILW
jgi:hypothetical protein